MPDIIYKLDEILAELGVTAHKVSLVSGLRPNTVYNIYNDTGTSINKKNLALILKAVNELAEESNVDKKYGIADLMEFIP
ncbi:helix-turn-helix domain-containing protein [Rossellomorea sp. H39__3]